MPSLFKYRLSLLGALCFFLSSIEYIIPKPLPFIRLGIANLPLLIALDVLPFPFYFLLLLLKVTGQALITGTLFSYVFIFSLAGTLASGVLMYFLRQSLGKNKISLVGVSTAGALASNGIQLLLARYIIFGSSIRYMALPIMGLGIVTGIILGIICEVFISRSIWYGSINNNQSHPVIEVFPQTKNKPSMELAIAALCMIPALLFNPDTIGRIIQCLYFFLLAFLFKKKVKPFFSILTISVIVFFNLLMPYGEIIFSLGPFRITTGALNSGIRRAVTLTGLLMLSRACINKDLHLRGFFGEILGEAFRIFAILGENKVKIKSKDWIGSIDIILLNTETQRHKENNELINISVSSVSSVRGTIYSRLFLFLMVILAWIPFFVNFN